MSCVEASIKPGQKLQNNGAMLVGCNLFEVPAVFVKGKPIFLSDGQSPLCQFLAAWYPVDFQWSLAVASQKVASVVLLAGDLDREADCACSNLTRGLDIGSQASNRGEYGRLREACSVVSEFVPS